jgi:hypothetical protein
MESRSCRRMPSVMSLIPQVVGLLPCAMKLARPVMHPDDLRATSVMPCSLCPFTPGPRLATHGMCPHPAAVSFGKPAVTPDGPRRPHRVPRALRRAALNARRAATDLAGAGARGAAGLIGGTVRCHTGRTGSVRDHARAARRGAQVAVARGASVVTRRRRRGTVPLPIRAAARLRTVETVTPGAVRRAWLAASSAGNQRIRRIGRADTACVAAFCGRFGGPPVHRGIRHARVVGIRVRGAAIARVGHPQHDLASATVRNPSGEDQPARTTQATPIKRSHLAPSCESDGQRASP